MYPTDRQTRYLFLTINIHINILNIYVPLCLGIFIIDSENKKFTYSSSVVLVNFRIAYIRTVEGRSRLTNL